jgi:hypothetical protein
MLSFCAGFLDFRKIIMNCDMSCPALFPELDFFEQEINTVIVQYNNVSQGGILYGYNIQQQ